MRANFRANLLRSWLRRKPAIAVLAALSFLLSVAGASPAYAQFDPFGWFPQLFQPPQPPRSPGHVAKPRPEMYRTAPEPRQARSRPSRSGGHGGEGITTKAQPKPAVAATYFVAVLGDSLAQLLAQGLSEAF